MNPIAMFIRANLAPLLVLGGLLGFAAFGAVQTHRLTLTKAELVKVTAEYEQFKGGVRALGEEAKRRAAVQTATDLRNKERADEENRKRTLAAAAAVRGLRAESDAARGSFLSALAAATRSADEAKKYGAKFERAYRELVQEIRAVGDDGDAAVIDLDSAKTWARDVQPLIHD